MANRSGCMEPLNDPKEEQVQRWTTILCVHSCGEGIHYTSPVLWSPCYFYCPVEFWPNERRLFAIHPLWMWSGWCPSPGLHRPFIKLWWCITSGSLTDPLVESLSRQRRLLVLKTVQYWVCSFFTFSHLQILQYRYTYHQAYFVIVNQSLPCLIFLEPP